MEALESGGEGSSGDRGTVIIGWDMFTRDYPGDDPGDVVLHGIDAWELQANNRRSL